jgi:hypothetical protein
MDELSPDDKQTVFRARKIQRFLSQPFSSAQVFTGREGRQVEVGDTVRGFKEILDGKHDDVAEDNFYMKGGSRVRKVNARGDSGMKGGIEESVGAGTSMATTLKLEIVTPDADRLLRGRPHGHAAGNRGQIGVYPMHIPLLTQIVPGEIIVQKDGQRVLPGRR